MSWSDVFPVMGDDEPLETQELGQENWFSVKEIFNRRDPGSYLVSTNLFWKRDFVSEEEVGEIDRFKLMNADSLGL